MGDEYSAEWALEGVGLVKKYRGLPALDGLDLRVPFGGVHGLIGPNGSGKTTTIRLALGLAHPDAGRLRVLGQDVLPGRADVVRRVGAIVDQPKFFPEFTGRHNLRLLAMSMGASVSRADEVIEHVGLSGWSRSKVANYSLGLKQRLAVAAALLNRPELVVLDEPTNGLDPAGIQQVRMLVRALAQQGCTVLISSHILAEVEQVVDTVSIISRGRLVVEGTLSDLLTQADRYILVTVSDAPGAAGVLAERWQVSAIDRDTLQVRSRPGEPMPEAAQINRALADQGRYARELVVRGESLEQAFLRLTTPFGVPFDQGGAA